jgi:NtrC-family two-component system sensor histidine kinase KinB
MRRYAVGLRERLLIWGALLVGVTVGSGYFSAVTFSRVSERTTEALRVDRENARLVHELAASLEDEDDALLLSLAGDSERTRAQEELLSQRRRFDDALARLRGVTTDPEEVALIGALERDEVAYREIGDRVMGGAPPVAREVYLHDVTPRLRQATTDCAKLREHRVRATKAVAAAASDDARSARYLVALGSVAALGLLVFIAWRIARTVLRPLRELTESVEKVRSGDFARRVVPRAEDELGRLGDGFNRMADALEVFHASQLGAVLAAKRTLEATLEALPEAVIVIDVTGRVTLSNARARRLLPRVGRLEELPFPSGTLEAIRNAAEGRVPSNPSRTDLGRAMTIAAFGETRLFLPRIICAGDGHRVVVVLDDVTELARLDEMRTEFIATASHELRTPLTTLQMTLSLLAEEPSSNDRRDETLATARLGCEQLTTTVDAFLDVTRMHSGRLLLGHDRVNVLTLLEQVCRSLRYRFEERGIRIATEAPAECSSDRFIVRGDRERLVAAMSNLLTNALKYSPPFGAVHVQVLSVEAGLHVVVDDEGPGVPEELRERVFEKYFRVEHVSPAREHVRGAGIGLYLCRRIVEAHDGSVRCDVSPRGGARFVLELPV